MKNERASCASLLDTIEQLNKTIGELKAKVNTLRKMCHNMEEHVFTEGVTDEDKPPATSEITHD
jgi:hypothetical protein